MVYAIGATDPSNEILELHTSSLNAASSALRSTGTKESLDRSFEEAVSPCRPGDGRRQRPEPAGPASLIAGAKALAGT